MASVDARDGVEFYLPLLIEGKVAELRQLFAGEPVIDDPREGHIEGEEALERFAEASRIWLGEREARAEHLRTTSAGGRSVVEALLHLVQAEKVIPLPVAVVAEEGNNSGINALRVYHSHWPLIGRHLVRQPLLEEDRNLEVSDIVGRYQRALTEGDLEAMLALFEPDGYAREPSGGDYVYRGPEGLRQFYSGLFSVGGIPLEHCTVTDDGICCAIEYNAVEWGGKPIARQAGVAVYERGRSGLLHAARIYDDVAVEEGV